MFNRILVALDDSETSKDIFQAALFLAKTVQARMMLLYVLLPEISDALTLRKLSDRNANPTFHDEIQYYPRAQQQSGIRGLEMLRSLRATATAAGVGVDFAQPIGHPGSMISNLSKSWGADLIVMGRRGIVPADDSVLGSVSNYVTCHAACPVLIVQNSVYSYSHPEHVPANQEASSKVTAYSPIVSHCNL